MPISRNWLLISPKLAGQIKPRGLTKINATMARTKQSVRLAMMARQGFVRGSLAWSSAPGYAGWVRLVSPSGPHHTKVERIGAKGEKRIVAILRIYLRVYTRGRPTINSSLRVMLMKKKMGEFVTLDDDD
jgi:hypothetical protein